MHDTCHSPHTRTRPLSLLYADNTKAGHTIEHSCTAFALGHGTLSPQHAACTTQQARSSTLTQDAWQVAHRTFPPCTAYVSRRTLHGARTQHSKQCRAAPPLSYPPISPTCHRLPSGGKLQVPEGALTTTTHTLQPWQHPATSRACARIHRAIRSTCDTYAHGQS